MISRRNLSLVIVDVWSGLLLSLEETYSITTGECIWDEGV